MERRAGGGFPDGSVAGSGGAELPKGGVQIGLQMQEFLQTHQFHGLDHPGIADHQKPGSGVLALLGELHQGTESGGVDEIDAAQVDHDGELGIPSPLGDEIVEMLVGVGVELAGEPEDQAVRLPLAAAAQGDGQSLQVGDGSSPRSRESGAV